LTIIKLNHESELATENHVRLYPSKETAALIDKYRMVVKNTPEGFVILYRKTEEFVAETVDNVLVIDGVEVIDKKIVGYVSTTPERTFSNWLPTVVDIDLEFYAIVDQKYRNDTKLDALALNEFIVYSAAELEGVQEVKNDINERIKPDALIQVNITDANITTPITLTFEIK
jgi:hypothetical protein